MDFFHIMGVAAWIGSAIFVGWLLMDFFKTNAAYDEEFLLSSREGHDEIAEQEKLHAQERENEK